MFASYFDAVDFKYFLSSFPDAKFLHLSYNKCSRLKVFCIQFSDAEFLHIKLDAVDFRYFVSSFPDAKFLHLSLMQWLLGILYSFYTFFTALVLLLLGIQDLQWVKNRLRGISMRLTENYKFGKHILVWKALRILKLPNRLYWKHSLIKAQWVER